MQHRAAPGAARNWAAIILGLMTLVFAAIGIGLPMSISLAGAGLASARPVELRVANELAPFAAVFWLVAMGHATAAVALAVRLPRAAALAGSMGVVGAGVAVIALVLALGGAGLSDAPAAGTSLRSAVTLLATVAGIEGLIAAVAVRTVRTPLLNLAS